MAKVFNLENVEFNRSKLRSKHLAIFLGCDVPPNFIHLYIANAFNLLKPSEVSILLLTHNIENNYFNHYDSLFSKLIEANTNIIHADDIVFNIGLKDLPHALWELDINKFRSKIVPFRNLSMYSIISTIIEPIHLFKNFSLDYLVINPFFKDLYKLQQPSLQKRFIYFEVANLDIIPKLNITEDLNKISMSFLRKSLIPFTEFKSKRNPSLPDLKTGLRNLIKSIYEKSSSTITLKVSSSDKLIDVTRSFSTKSKIDMLKLLKTPLSMSDISRKLKMSVSTVKKHLDEMEDAGILYRTINKKYYLKSKNIDLKISID